MAEKEKVKEEKAKEVKKEEEVSESLPCPFCDGEMVEVSRIGIETYYEVTRECKECGFQATFKESA